MLEVDLEAAERGFEPGEEIAGVARWTLDLPPGSAEVRLFWFTQGKGTQDVQVVATEHFDNPGSHDRRTFRFRLPDSPYSFSGKLVSLVWAVELVLAPSGDARRVEFVMAPERCEVRLDAGS